MNSDMRRAEDERLAELAGCNGVLRYMASLSGHVTPGHFDEILDDTIRRLMVASHTGRIGSL